MTEGPYKRGVKNTELLFGYWEKLFLKSIPTSCLEPTGSDCRTKRTITITI